MGLQVSPYCLGATRDAATVRVAFEAGINFFFLSWDLHYPIYDQTREGLRALLRSTPELRAQMVIAAVGYVENTRFLEAAAGELLYACPELQYIDIALAGASMLGSFGPRLAAARRGLARDGVRAHGASFHSRAAALLAIAERQVDIAFIRYNPSHPGAARDLLPHLPSDRTALVYNFTSTHGYVPEPAWTKLGLTSEHWRPAHSDYYRFVLTRPEIDGLLVAPARPEHIESLHEAIAAGPLDADEEEYLVRLSALARGELRLR